MSGSSSIIRARFDISSSSFQLVALVFDDGSLRHVDGQLADVRDVIADSFQVLGYEQQARVARGGVWRSNHHPDEFAKNLIVQIIDLGISQNDFARSGSIGFRKRVESLCQH